MSTTELPEKARQLPEMQQQRAGDPPADQAERIARGLSVLLSVAKPPVAEDPPATAADAAPAATPAEAPQREHAQWARLLTGPWPLLCVLAVQAVLSLRLVRSGTAFQDEALYLWAGHLEWANWLHGTAIPAFPSFFSGAPVIYPPLGALADSVGGLAGARILSLCFMLGATAMLWSTTSRLFGKRAGFFAAALWAVLGPTVHLGAYATFDAMSLFLITLAAWCASARRSAQDPTVWIVAAAAALVLANVTKYASALFDPVVVAVAVMSAYPVPGGKVALRRGALLLTCLTGCLAALWREAGTYYVRGVEQTTTVRMGNVAPVQAVLGDSLRWIGIVIMLSAAAVVLSLIGRRSRSKSLFLAALTAAALLAPAEQARIHTTTSLNKHVDFGAWFAAVAAGYLISLVASLPKNARLRALATAGLAACLLPVAVVGYGQGKAMTYGYWPNVAALVTKLRPMISHGGRFLAEGQYVPAYYLHDMSWEHWSNTRSVILPSGKSTTGRVGGQGDPALYARLIQQHYFSVVMLTFTDTVSLDNEIAADLRASPGYRMTAFVPFGVGNGGYSIWQYLPQAGAR